MEFPLDHVIFYIRQTIFCCPSPRPCGILVDPISPPFKNCNTGNLGIYFLIPYTDMDVLFLCAEKGKKKKAC